MQTRVWTRPEEMAGADLAPLVSLHDVSRLVTLVRGAMPFRPPYGTLMEGEEEQVVEAQVRAQLGQEEVLLDPLTGDFCVVPAVPRAIMAPRPNAAIEGRRARHFLGEYSDAGTGDTALLSGYGCRPGLAVNVAGDRHLTNACPADSRATQDGGRTFVRTEVMRKLLACQIDKFGYGDAVLVVPLPLHAVEPRAAGQFYQLVPFVRVDVPAELLRR